MNPTIMLSSGIYFDLLSPQTSAFTINDIAHALSQLCRFTGHTSEFYSVAEHSLRASYLVPKDYAMQSLLHDAAEAFVGDVSSPLKHLLPNYKDIEQAIQVEIFRRFDCPLVEADEVKLADLIMLATERRDLLPPSHDVWPIIAQITPKKNKIFPMDSMQAKIRFMKLFEELGGLDWAMA